MLFQWPFLNIYILWKKFKGRKMAATWVVRKCHLEPFVHRDFLACQAKKSFSWHIVTGDENWIYFDNPKRRKSWVDPGQPRQRQNIHGYKALLCNSWDQEDVLYYEILHPNETVTVDRYRQQLYWLSDELMRKRPSVASNRRKAILLHDDARPHVARIVKES